MKTDVNENYDSVEIATTSIVENYESGENLIINEGFVETFN